MNTAYYDMLIKLQQHIKKQATENLKQAQKPLYIKK